MKKIFILFFFLVSTFQKAQINLDSNLVACYALNGNGYEAITGLHASFIGNVVDYPNHFNANFSAVAFNGMNGNMLELPDTSLLKPNTLSFSAWIKPLQGFTSTGYLLYTKNTNTSTTNTEAYSLSIENTSQGKKLRLKKSNGTNSTQLDNTTIITTNVWHHICFTMDNNFLNLYVDGVLEGSTPTTVNFNYAVNKNIYLGASNETGNMGYFTGAIDNVRFYNRILSAAEVNQLYLTDPSCIATTQAPVASFSVSGPCVNQEVTFVDLSTNNPDTWQWQISGGTNTNQYNPVYTFSATGNYTATMISSNVFGSDTISLPFYINPPPPVTAIASRTHVCNGLTVTLTAQGAANYTWSTSQTATSIVVAITYSTPTLSTHTVIGSDSNGCRGTGIVQLKKSSDCINSLSAFTKGSSNIYLYPNPSDGKFIVESPETKPSHFKVYNLFAELIQQGEFKHSEKVEINLENEASGIYYVVLLFENSNETLKFVKE